MAQNMQLANTMKYYHKEYRKRPILTYPIGKASLGSFPLKVFKKRT